MKASPAHPTSAEDRISNQQKLAYGVGGLVNNLLGAAIPMMAIVLNLGLGMDPALVGFLMALPRLTDAFTDPLMGYISDHTRSRWGRRRHYIFVGAISGGLIFALLWQLPEGYSQTFYFWYFLAGSIIFYLAYTVFATPWVAFGYEMTPDYNERTRLMAVTYFLGQIPWLAAPWFYWLMEWDGFASDSVSGARKLAIMIGVFVVFAGIIPALFCRERLKSVADEEQPLMSGLLEHFTSFLKGFLVTVKFGPFLKLCLATFLVFNGFMMVSSFSSYVMIFYVHGGDRSAGAALMGWNGSLTTIATLGVIPLITWISSRIGKQRAFHLGVGISLMGYASKWFLYNPEQPYLILLSAPFVAFGLGCLFTLMSSMVADVCDLDELNTGSRREGMFGSIFWWVVKLGTALAFSMGGILLNVTGFDETLPAQTESTLLMMRLFDIGVPLVTSAIAIAIVATYPLTEAKALDVRAQLEARRGKA
jgi:GPH family glycoside/pentoside/hexuronide:cation symporter